jgi:hypothetical protein
VKEVLGLAVLKAALINFVNIPELNGGLEASYAGLLNV